MASHNQLGRTGESMGRVFLASKGYNILHVNWKHSYYEIDIIATKNGTLHFVEVKTRRGQRFGLPEEGVDEKKMEKIFTAADEFLVQYPEWEKVEYDILSINFNKDNVPEFFLLEDVYL